MAASPGNLAANLAANSSHQSALVVYRFPSAGDAVQVSGLRQIIAVCLVSAVLIRPTIDDRGGLEIAMRRRRGSGPFQGVAVPRIPAGRFAAEQAVEEIDDEYELYHEQHKGADSYELVQP